MSDEDWPDEDEEETTCVEGYTDDECCNCVYREGIEHCEFMCPFGGPERRLCYTEKCEIP